MEADLLPNPKIRIASLMFRRRAAGNLTHTRLNLNARLSQSRQKRREGNLWQRRFWEHWIRDEQDLIQHCDYIHYNPVRHGLCRTPGEWKYSSFHRYVAQGIYPSDWGQLGEPEIPFLTGCPTSPICTKVTDTRSSHLTLHLSEGCDSNRPAAIYSIYFIGKKQAKPLWTISSSEGESRKSLQLSTVEYGVIPEGFSGETAAKLQPGEAIEIRVYGVGVAESQVITLTE